MQIVVDGLLTTYTKEGSGPVVVCLHGWGDSSATFSKLSEELKDKYQILALDLPGFGGSQVPAVAWKLQNYAEFVAAWLKKIGVTDVFAIVGHSYGGSIATTGLANKNLTAKKLVLLASAGVRNRHSVRKKMITYATKAGKVSTFWMPASQKQKMRRKLYKKIGSDLMVVPQLEETFKQIIAQDIQAEAAKINIPTLLIYGSDDNQTPVADGKLLHEAIKNSQLEIINGAGHFIHLEETEKVQKLTKDFLYKK